MGTVNNSNKIWYICSDIVVDNMEYIHGYSQQ